MKLLQSCIIAFSMYSKVPMPHIEWDEENMKYVFAFFPLVGAVIGAIICGVDWLCVRWGFGIFFTACLMTVLPLLLTGGIHMDGFLDTVDALCSYGDREKKLKILKDPNTGAFAVIYGLIYIVLSLAFWSELPRDAVPFMGMVFVVSRTFSGLGVVTFPPAKNTGLAASFGEGAQKKRVKTVLICWLVFETAVLLYARLPLGLAVLLVSGMVFLFYYCMSRRLFGGITGDLAGFFLQVCELAAGYGLLAAARI